MSTDVAVMFGNPGTTQHDEALRRGGENAARLQRLRNRRAQAEPTKTSRREAQAAAARHDRIEGLHRARGTTSSSNTTRRDVENFLDEQGFDYELSFHPSKGFIAKHVESRARPGKKHEFSGATYALLLDAIKAHARKAKAASTQARGSKKRGRH